MARKNEWTIPDIPEKMTISLVVEKCRVNERKGYVKSELLDIFRNDEEEMVRRVFERYSRKANSFVLVLLESPPSRVPESLSCRFWEGPCHLVHSGEKVTEFIPSGTSDVLRLQPRTLEFFVSVPFDYERWLIAYPVTHSSVSELTRYVLSLPERLVYG